MGNLGTEGMLNACCVYGSRHTLTQTTNKGIDLVGGGCKRSVRIWAPSESERCGLCRECWQTLGGL